VFEVLAAAIDEMEIPTDRPALVEALRLSDRLEAKVSGAVGEFDARQVWRLDDAPSMVAWLVRRGRLAEAAARQSTSMAARLRDFPLTRRAWLDGVLSSGQVRAITATVTETTAALYAQHEVDLVPALVGLGVRDTTAVMRTWVARPSVFPDDTDFGGDDAT
jgi:hypothetical protein